MRESGENTNVVIEPSRLAAHIMSAACEDYTGLYEIIWALSTDGPELSENMKRTAAQHAVSDLMRRGFVQLFKAAWLSHTYDLLSTEDAQAVILDPDSWAPPAQEGPGVYYCFAATPEGEVAYCHGELGTT